MHIAALIFLLTFSVAAEGLGERLEIRPLQLNYEYWTMRLPGNVGVVPTHPKDSVAIPGTRRCSPSGALFSYDFSIGVLPLPWETKEWFYIGYIARLYVVDGDYRSGVYEKESYVDERWDSFTYAQLSRVDFLSHNVLAEVRIPIHGGLRGTLGWRHLFPTGIEVTEGWDRWGTNQELLIYDGTTCGDAATAGIVFREDGLNLGMRLEWGRYDTDFGDEGRGSTTTLALVVSVGFQF